MGNLILINIRRWFTEPLKRLHWIDETVGSISKLGRQAESIRTALKI
nr:hypothetical protein [Candidatus Freyarchaeota archaeon]